MPATLSPFFYPTGAGVEPALPPPADGRVLGHDGTSWFVVQGDGAVRLVDPASPLNTRLVNSSEKHFFASLDALAERRAEADRAATSHDALLAISSLRHDLNRINILALGDRDNFWAMVLDRLEAELP